MKIRQSALLMISELAGFSDNDISVLFPDKQGTRDFAHEQHTKAPEGAVSGVVTGGIIGGALGWLVGIGSLAIPGVGPFIAAGPILAALSGVAAGGTVGGIAGGLIGMGIPEYEAKRYEGKIRDGNILISVHAENSDEVSRAKDIFKNGGAEDVAYSGEESVNGKSRGEVIRKFMHGPPRLSPTRRNHTARMSPFSTRTSSQCMPKRDASTPIMNLRTGTAMYSPPTRVIRTATGA